MGQCLGTPEGRPMARDATQTGASTGVASVRQEAKAGADPAAHTDRHLAAHTVQDGSSGRRGAPPAAASPDAVLLSLPSISGRPPSGVFHHAVSAITAGGSSQQPASVGRGPGSPCESTEPRAHSALVCTAAVETPSPAVPRLRRVSTFGAGLPTFGAGLGHKAPRQAGPTTSETETGRVLLVLWPASRAVPPATPPRPDPARPRAAATARTQPARPRAALTPGNDPLPSRTGLLPPGAGVVLARPNAPLDGTSLRAHQARHSAAGEAPRESAPTSQPSRTAHMQTRPCTLHGSVTVQALTSPPQDPLQAWAACSSQALPVLAPFSPMPPPSPYGRVMPPPTPLSRAMPYSSPSGRALPGPASYVPLWQAPPKARSRRLSRGPRGTEEADPVVNFLIAKGQFNLAVKRVMSRSRNTREGG